MKLTEQELAQASKRLKRGVTIQSGLDTFVISTREAHVGYIIGTLTYMGKDGSRELYTKVFPNVRDAVAALVISAVGVSVVADTVRKEKNL